MWSDLPLRDDSEDRLARGAFADRVANLIEASDSGSTVFGLVGPWGSGKTSLVTMVRRRLNNSWKVLDFTPWASSDLPSMLAEFYSVIASATPPKRGKKARAAVLDCAKVSVPVLGGVPVVGGALKEAGAVVLDRLGRDGTWVQRFEEACTEIGKLDLRALVVIDDVDRLHADELATLLKAVRLLGRFPGVHYLLSYDETTVLDVLSASAVVGHDPDRALAFLEKIVQLPLTIPPAQRSQLDVLVNEGLTNLLEDSGATLSRDDMERFAWPYGELMCQTLTTVRSIRRYLVQASAYLPLLGTAEVDLIDFLVLTYVRLTFPKLHTKLPAWKDELTRDGLHRDSAPGGPPRPRWEELIASAGVPATLVDAVQSALTSVFPAIAKDVWSAGAVIGSYGAPCRASSAEYFDRYFALGVPVDDVADTVVRRALGQAIADGGSDWDEVRRRITDGTSDSPSKLRFVNKLAQLASERSVADAQGLARTAAQLVPDLPDGQTFVGNPRLAGLLWLGAEIRRIEPDGVDPEALLIELVSDTQDLVHVLYALDVPRPTIAPRSVARALADRAAAQAAELTLANFRARDAAPNEPVIAFIDFIRTHGDADGLRAAVRAAIVGGEFSIEDVAARCVSISISPETGELLEIIGFEQERFLWLVPSDLLLEHAASASPGGPGFGEVDLADLSWPGRREAARRPVAELRDRLQA